MKRAVGTCQPPQHIDMKNIINPEMLLRLRPAIPMLFLFDRMTIGIVQAIEHREAGKEPFFSWRDAEGEERSYFHNLEALAIDYFHARYTGEHLYDVDLIAYALDDKQSDVLARAFITAQLRPVAPAAYLSGFVQAAYQCGRISTDQYNCSEFQASISFLSMLLRNRNRLPVQLDTSDIPY